MPRNPMSSHPNGETVSSKEMRQSDLLFCSVLGCILGGVIFAILAYYVGTLDGMNWMNHNFNCSIIRGK